MFIPLNHLLVIYIHWYKYMCSSTEEKADGESTGWTSNTGKGELEADDT